MADIIVLSQQILLNQASIDAAFSALQDGLLIVEIGSDRTIEFAMYIWDKIVNPKVNSLLSLSNLVKY